MKQLKNGRERIQNIEKEIGASGKIQSKIENWENVELGERGTKLK